VCYRWATALEANLTEIETKIQIKEKAIPLGYTKAMLGIFAVVLSILAASAFIIAKEARG
jgi:hypothetical protein